jgi:hypothetical protein
MQCFAGFEFHTFEVHVSVSGILSFLDLTNLCNEL